MYLLLTTAVIGGSFVFINRLLRKRFGASGSTAHAVNDGTRYVRLRKMEVKMLTMPKGPYRVCTITWFEGDHESAAVCLKARLANLLTANKWLTGHFVKRNSAHYLTYASSVDIDNAVRRLFCHVVPDE
jgi:hypothetical protein